MNKPLPFSIDQVTCDSYYIEIVPKHEKCLALMKAKKLDTIVKFCNALQYQQVKEDGKDKDSWGLVLPKNNGLLIGERVSLKDSLSKRKAMSDYLSLMIKIHDETKLPLEKIQKYFKDPFKYANELKEYLGEISGVFNNLNDQNDQSALITVMLRERLIEGWTEQDTMALHAFIYDEIAYYCDMEQNGWEEKTTESAIEEDDEDEEEQMVGEQTETTLPEDSPSSKASKKLTGGVSILT